jgi:hypothetical protein
MTVRDKSRGGTELYKADMLRKVTFTGEIGPNLTAVST